jgi:chromosomal replication initiation ATPase DnaA
MLISPYVYPGLPRAENFTTTHKDIIFERVAHIVCSINGISFSELLGDKRHRPFIMGRCMVSWVLRHRYNFTFAEIGRFMGNKHHTTIIHHVSVHAVDMSVNNQGYRDKYFLLLKEL